MTVLVYLKEAVAIENGDNIIAYPVAEINISQLMDRITKKYGSDRAKKFNVKNLITYAASYVMKRPEEIILRSKICKGA